MTRVLAYCGWLNGSAPAVVLPETGVGRGLVNILTEGRLSLLWSKVEWPFEPSSMQQSSVEFHQVVNHVFAHTAVVPFRLLTVFEDERSLMAFAAQHREQLVADLGRLQGLVQMECVVYFVRSRPAGSEDEYSRQNAELRRIVSEHVQDTSHALSDLSRDVRVREVKSGTRMFVLVERDKEDAFRAAVQQVVVPQLITRRIRGPRPADEFLRESIHAIQAAG